MKSSSSNKSSEYGFGEINVLKNYNNKEDANKLLHKLAATVTPLMHRRRWRVPVLKEFFPTNPNLLGLNVNHGQSILVRLRPASNKDSFYDWEHCLGTLIHELTHILIGPHNAEFYKTMDGLDDEIQKDIANGSVSSTISASSGSTFFVGAGHKLGNGNTPKVNPDNLSRERKASLAAAAAANRLKTIQLTSGSGSKLGGGAREILTKEQLRQRVVEAAERRMRDDKQCGSAWEKQPEINSNNNNKYNNNTTTAVPANEQKSSQQSIRTTTNSTSATSSLKTSVSSTQSKQVKPPTKYWSCALCYTNNIEEHDVCSYCFSEKIDESDYSDMIPRSTSSSSSAADGMSIVTFEGGMCAPCAPSATARVASSEREDILLIDLTEQDMETDEIAPPFNAIASSYGSSSSSSSSSSSRYEPGDQELDHGFEFDDDGWACPMCTYHNAVSSASCTVCLTAKPYHGLADTAPAAKRANQSLYWNNSYLK